MTTYRERHLAGVHANPNEGLSVDQMKAQLKALGLSSSGSKAELEQRLKDAGK